MRHAAGPGPGPSAVLPPCVRTLYHMSLGVLTKISMLPLLAASYVIAFEALVGWNTQEVQSNPTWESTSRQSAAER